MIKPLSKLEFRLNFTPNDVTNYQFDLPLTLFGNEKIDSLKRTVICRGLKPRFLMEPKIIEFKKKIITNMDKTFPSYTEITISNPDMKPLTWKIDTY